MIKTFIPILIIVLLFLACEEKKDEGIVLISSGSSFGECLGYCMRDMQIDEDGVSYKASSYDPEAYPTRTLNEVFSDTEWDDLVALVDMDEFQEFEDVIGCPDCADGGAEYIEIQTSESTKRITFEYGATLSSIQEIVQRLRVLRASYETRVFDK